MKRTIIALATLLAGGNAYAASDFVDTAQVISAKPIIERVADTRQECSPAPAPQKSGGVIAPIIGGVVGGLLGHQVGQGSGQTAATIVGATGGAVAGSAIGNRAGSQPEQQCRTVESSREVVNGYDVVYRYNGRDVNVALPYNPGSTIKVGVSAMPDDRSAEMRRDERDSRPDGYDSRPPRRRGPPY
jgi:uncharacterized protein YcfJ